MTSGCFSFIFLCSLNTYIVFIQIVILLKMSQFRKVWCIYNKKLLSIEGEGVKGEVFAMLTIKTF